MKDLKINNFTELHQLIDRCDARTVIYRGIKSTDLPLIPKIGRVVPPDSIGSREKNEQEILRLFKERAFQYLDFTPTTDWDWLAVGQQYVLPTRLLDWTDNPLVACFFAVDEESQTDSVIYAYRNDSYISTDKYSDPFKYKKKEGKFIPKHLVQRITTQGGLFTIHPNPFVPFESVDMEKIIIPNQIRMGLKKTINRY